MQEERTNVPKIRFKGYAEEWEERKLGEVADVIGGGTPNTNIPEYWDGNIDWYSPAEIGEQTYVTNSQKKISQLGLQKSSAKILPIGTVLFTSRAGIGNTAILAKEGSTNQGFQSIVPRKRILDSYFIFSRTYELKKYGELTGAGSTFIEVSGKQMANMPMLFPTFEEQQKIGTFFKQLDDTIALHQRKLDLLKQTKQSYLQKMFPKKGEDKPEIRFAGFTDAWEQRKFFDNIKNTIDFRGRTPKKLGMDWSDSGYLALSALNVRNGYIDPSADAHYGDQELYDKWMTGKDLYEGQVLFTTEAPMGNVAQVPDNNKYILSQRTIAFDVNSDKITDDFLAVLLRSPKSFNELSSLASGGTAKGVSQKSLSQFKVTLPNNLEEQKKIGTFFKQLDNTIALHQRELDSLKEMKKSLLQQMFV
ncbi:restriction endonuclease subunit S [Enterococcus faecium]|uniref:restriction endonuclease subunit S n=1 Tax=Enterococcus faecium TaxID=1352 RepID=UPI000A330A87|nr:restriction endonuclease subunit S [Enterococcus faecium]EGP4759988.1 restriction endonuclease subunit S [Enterococcus faecium]EGP5416898.1 restriction endonuclease subunit S [Enterococcus faecium]EJB5627405.1 restriction endonuclease subunit S [Enterococcus faecium]OTO98769.1 type I restriction enzyme specificity protein [Enterococcus faecium]OTP05452.1 type I restriction enzyme specificity protein [Enterococcus faecium]